MWLQWLTLCLDDTCGVLKEPEILNKEYDDLSDDSENIDLTNYNIIIDDLQVSDVYQEFVYYDPLRTGDISFKHVYGKVNLFKKLLG